MIEHDEEYTDRDFLDALAATQQGNDARRGDAARLLQLLTKTKQVRSHRRLLYRCAKNCTLLEVFQFPEPLGWIFRQPDHRFSPGVNEATSNAAGRRANTNDGDRRWRGNIILPEQFENLNLHCGHLHHVLIDQSRMLNDAQRFQEVTLDQSDDTTRIASM